MKIQEQLFYLVKNFKQKQKNKRKRQFIFNLRKDKKICLRFSHYFVDLDELILNIYFVGSDKVFFYYNYIIGGKNPKIDRNIYKFKFVVLFCTL